MRQHYKPSHHLTGAHYFYSSFTVYDLRSSINKEGAHKAGAEIFQNELHTTKDANVNIPASVGCCMAMVVKRLGWVWSVAV